MAIKRYALLQVGCAECSGGDSSLVQLRGTFGTVDEAKAAWPEDREPWLYWRQDELDGQWYAGHMGGGYEIVDLEG